MTTEIEIIPPKQAAAPAPKKQSLILRALDMCYDTAVGGLGPLVSAHDLAEEYRRRPGSLAQQIDSLIRWQVSKAGMAGLATGMGGWLTLPITIPANLASVMVVQVRMIAAIAELSGHDLKEDRVKSLVFACLLGNELKDLLKEIGVVLAKNVVSRQLEKITVNKLNQRVSARMVEKAGEQGGLRLGKLVPLVGGLISGGLDASATYAMGRIAKKVFLADFVPKSD